MTGTAVVGAPEARPFFHRIQTLRGIGAVMVAGWHVSGWLVNGVQLLPHTPWPMVGGVQNAVGAVELALLPHAALMVFFVISGFVLRVSLQYGPQEAARAAARLHIARIFRIYPVVIIGMLLAAMVSGSQLSASNLLLVDASPIPELWAIQVELLITPVIVLLYFVERSWGPAVLLAIAIVTSALSFDGGWAVWPPLSQNLFAFVLGMVVPTVGRRLVGTLSVSRAHILTVAVILGLFLITPTLGFFSRWSTLFEGYLAFALISLVAYRTDVRALRVLDWRPLEKVGRASASIYVLHMPVFAGIIAPLARAVPEVMSITMPALVGPVVLVLALVPLTLASVISYHVVESPGTSLGRRINAAWRLSPQKIPELR